MSACSSARIARPSVACTSACGGKEVESSQLLTYTARSNSHPLASFPHEYTMVWAISSTA